jgi:hypothetical protein
VPARGSDKSEEPTKSIATIRAANETAGGTGRKLQLASGRLAGDMGEKNLKNLLETKIERRYQ